MILYRPTGRAELCLVARRRWQAWPPGLPEQPIFYPVTSYAYAEKIARDWNSVRPAPDNVGFVTRFAIDAATAARYPVEEAGGIAHQELWVPAEELEAFDRGIVGTIEVLAGFRDGVALAAADRDALVLDVG